MDDGIQGVYIGMCDGDVCCNLSKSIRQVGLM